MSKDRQKRKLKALPGSLPPLSTASVNGGH
jgi:hypothetical protein